jgi:capsid portal protein
MKRQDAIDVTKLNEILNNPDLERDYQEVFSFVKTITNGTVKPNDLTDTNIETWNRRFDEVLEQLFSGKTKEEGKKKKQIK